MKIDTPIITDGSLNGTSIYSASSVYMINGSDTLAITGLSLSFIPTISILTVSKPLANNLNIIATVQLNSINNSGFTAHFTASPDTTGYKLNYLLLP